MAEVYRFSTLNFGISTIGVNKSGRPYKGAAMYQLNVYGFVDSGYVDRIHYERRHCVDANDLRNTRLAVEADVRNACIDFDQKLHEIFMKHGFIPTA